jgi:hypothetical protein
MLLVQWDAMRYLQRWVLSRYMEDKAELLMVR